MDIINLINQEIRRSAKPDAQKIASKLYVKVAKSDLRILLLHEVDHRIRAMVSRPAERSDLKSFVAMAESLGGGSKSRVASMIDEIMKAPSDLRTALNCRFALGDGVRISWGEATVEQHRDRILYLSKMRDGIDNTIRLHQEAVELIESKRVSCLNEIVD